MRLEAAAARLRFPVLLVALAGLGIAGLHAVVAVLMTAVVVLNAGAIPGEPSSLLTSVLPALIVLAQVAFELGWAVPLLISAALGLGSRAAPERLIGSMRWLRRGWWALLVRITSLALVPIGLILGAVL